MSVFIIDAILVEEGILIEIEIARIIVRRMGHDITHSTSLKTPSHSLY